MSGSRGDNGPIAVVGMAGRFPGADGVDEFWSLLMSGTEAVRRFSADELRAARVPRELRENPTYVPFGADLGGVEEFDAAFFGITPAEARLTDPQQRLFLECCWAALEDAGTPPPAHEGNIGVFGGTSFSAYLLRHVLASADYRDAEYTYPVLTGNDKDFLATRVSYRLGLSGPSVTIQTACSSSLVAVDAACSALRSGACDVALAGGTSLAIPQTAGHLYREGGTFSRDGHCRPFDVEASGMVRGSGCGVVVLKRLADAQADRDRLLAVVAGTAVNNDGSAKAGFAAPSATGQAKVIRACLEAAELPASTIGYVETHGTGTYLGDPIEVEGLTLAYRDDPPPVCGLGSVKANIGHLDAAAGIASLMKAVLVLHHQTLPPQINYVEPNPELRLADTPFTVHSRAHRPRSLLMAAAVTSLGIGGTNAHCVLTVPQRVASRARRALGAYTLLLSAPEETQIPEVAADLVAYLERHPETRLDDLAYTLIRGRQRWAARAAVSAFSLSEAISALRDLRDGRSRPPADRAARCWTEHGVVPYDQLGDVENARKIRLPGLRMHRIRHWIEPAELPGGDVAPAWRNGGFAQQPPRLKDQDRPKASSADPLPHTTEAPVDAVPGSVLDTVLSAFRARLGTAAVRSDDDYFALGGDSLVAIDLVEDLCHALGAPLTLDSFARLRTPRGVARWTETRSAPDSASPVLIKEGTGDREVFLVHPSGGTLAFAHALARHSSYPGRLYGISYPLALRETLTSVPALARHYAGLIRGVRPRGPYRLGGYSFGGTVALEMARVLTGHGERVEPVLLFDAPAPGGEPGPCDDKDLIASFPDLLQLTLGLPPGGARRGPMTVEEAMETMRQPHWTEATVRELRKLYEVWRVCSRAWAAYRPRPYAGPVHLFRARARPPISELTGVDPSGGEVTEEGWRPYVMGELKVTTVPGHHFTMFEAEHVPVLAAEFDRVLATPPRPGPSRAQVALLFPGQGVQYPGMGADLLARYPSLVEEADDVLGYRVSVVCAGDLQRPLTDTAYAQPALYVVHALAVRRHVEETGQPPTVTLGHSLGEYNALEASGAFTFAEGLRLVARRGTLMAAVQGGGMVSVTGLPMEALRELLVEPSFALVDLAADNAPLIHTLAGPHEELQRLTPVLLDRGATAVRGLNVSGPFHSRMMRSAALAFRPALDRARLTAPSVPVIANSTAEPHQLSTLPEQLTAQMHQVVLWRPSIQRVIAEHDPTFHEIGGHRVLTPLLARIREVVS